MGRAAPLIAAALVALTWGIWLGLLRLGWVLPLPRPEQLILHGPLMIGGFLGTVMGVELAAETPGPFAFLAPIASALGALVLVLGPPGVGGASLVTLASLALLLALVRTVLHERSLAACARAVGAVFWLVGNVQWLAGAAIYRVVGYWAAFVVVTISAERVQLAGIRAHRRQVLFAAVIATIAVGTIASAVSPSGGQAAVGIGTIAAAWYLLQFDRRPRAIPTHGAEQYTATCLLLGDLWLGVAGGFLVGIGPLTPGTLYDATLHALFVGFVVSMIFGHAPMVVPAVLGRPLPFSRWLYLPVAILHVSVVLRVVGDVSDSLGRLRAWGGLFNAVAVGLFVAIAAASSRVGPRLAPSVMQPPG